LPLKKLSVIVRPTASYGGNGGNFDKYFNDKPNWHITGFFIKYQMVISGIKFKMSHRDSPWIIE
jgi:hypothetical protein